MRTPSYIAITGTFAAGKDTIGAYLEKNHGFRHVSAGDVLRTKARELGYQDPIARTTLEEIGDQLHKEYGRAPITNEALRQYRTQVDTFPGGLAISGLRRVSEVRALKQAGGNVWFVDAIETVRFEHTSRRNRGDDLTFTAFHERGEAEMYGDPTDEDSINLSGIKDMADRFIDNSGSRQELEAIIDRLLADFQP